MSPLTATQMKCTNRRKRENCTIHILAGMGCWNTSKVLQESEICNSWLHLLCGVKLSCSSVILKIKKVQERFTQVRFDSREAVGCANLLRQVSFKFYNTSKKTTTMTSNKTVTLRASPLPNLSYGLFQLLRREWFYLMVKPSWKIAASNKIKQLTSNQSKIKTPDLTPWNISYTVFE